MSNDSKTSYNMTIEELFTKYSSNKDGLTTGDAQSIRARVGENEIPEHKVGFYRKYLKPVINLMIIILFFSALLQIYFKVKFGEGSWFSPILIIVILFINILLAMRQQYKAEKTIDALESLTAYQCKALRDGFTSEINTNDLVPGDIIILNQGDFIAADARIIQSNNLVIDESNLTGESLGVNKTTASIDENNLLIQEQKNMIFSSTFVSSGNGKAIVVATGIDTEIGKISKGIAQKEQKEIPLNKSMNQLGTILGLLVLIVITSLFTIKVVQGSDNLLGELNWLVSLAVTAIPFNFPLIATIILLTRVLYLSKKQAIVRNLNALETMGRLTVICSDKTGTLTQNEMTVKKIFYNNKIYDVSGQGYDFEGEILLGKQRVNVLQDIYLWKMIINGVVNNNAELAEEEMNLRIGTKKITKVLGSPTEGSLLTLAKKCQINPQIERANYEIKKELSFTSQRKMMSKIVKRDGNTHCLSKGAPEIILANSTKIILDGVGMDMLPEHRVKINDQLKKFAEQGYRTLAFAFRPLKNDINIESLKPEMVERDLIYLGFVALLDPPRKGVKEAIEVCNDAGIKVIMITGDHPITAKTIGTELGIYGAGDLAITGKEILNLKDEDFNKISIFARVNPEDKNIIIEKLQKLGHVVAMTGDGVNDALALENADVGIAMGMRGTDVAKNASDLILTDDSFNTIETALFHGRGLFNNIRTNIVFLLVCNLMELFVLTIISLVYNEFLFSPLQLIILYALPHFFPPLGLMFDKYSPNIMKELPKKKNEPLVNKSYVKMMLLQIFVIGGIIIAVWILIDMDIYLINDSNLATPHFINPITGNEVIGFANTDGEEYINILDLKRAKLWKAQTVCFLILVFSEIWVVYESRSDKTSIIKGRTNVWLNFLIMVVVISCILLVYLDLTRSYLHFTGLSYMDWGIIFGASLIVVFVTEIWKLI